MHIRRTIIASAIAIATVLGTSACNLVSPVASMDYYAPSEGAQADLGRLKARNLMYFVIDKDHYGLVGSFVNSSPEEIAFALTFDTNSGKDTYRQYTLPANSVISFGYQNQPVLKVDLKVESAISAEELEKDPSLLAGSSVPVFLDTNTDQVKINVPVMGKDFPGYEDLVARMLAN